MDKKGTSSRDQKPDQKKSSNRFEKSLRYNKLSLPSANMTRLEKIRALFKDYLANRTANSQVKLGKVSKPIKQPMGNARAMTNEGGGKTSTTGKEILPLERYGYYHGCLSRDDAEEILAAEPVGHFLVRASQRGKDNYTIVVSIRVERSMAHYQIPVDDTGKFYFNEFSFEHVHELLYFHWKQKIPISLIGDKEVSLIKSVDRPDWLFDDNDVVLEPNPLGEGNFGAVYRGSVIACGKKIPLAVKTLQNPENKVGREELLHEARIIRKLKNPGIVRCYGITVSSEATMVLLEYVPAGSLDKYLRKTTLTPAVKIKLLQTCADGINFIHKSNVIHRDLAARNLLLVMNGNNQPSGVKICDFGLARFNVKEFRLSTAQQIPLRWSAPETLEQKVWTSKTDVWSFGVIIYEFFNNAALPYYEMDPLDGTILLKHLKSGSQLRPGRDMPQSVSDLMTSIFNIDPNSRPDMAEVLRTMDDIVKQNPT